MIYLVLLKCIPHVVVKLRRFLFAVFYTNHLERLTYAYVIYIYIYIYVYLQGAQYNTLEFWYNYWATLNSFTLSSSGMWCFYEIKSWLSIYHIWPLFIDVLSLGMGAMKTPPPPNSGLASWYFYFWIPLRLGINPSRLGLWIFVPLEFFLGPYIIICL